MNLLKTTDTFTSQAQTTHANDEEKKTRREVTKTEEKTRGRNMNVKQLDEVADEVGRAKKGGNSVKAVGLV